MRETEEKAVIGERVYLRLAAAAIPPIGAEGPVPVDPDLAEMMGAFEEDALGPEEAIDSLIDGEAPDFALAAEDEGGAHE